MQVVLKPMNSSTLNEKWAFIEKNHSAKVTSLKLMNKGINILNLFLRENICDEELKDILKAYKKMKTISKSYLL